MFLVKAICFFVLWYVKLMLIFKHLPLNFCNCKSLLSKKNYFFCGLGNIIKFHKTLWKILPVAKHDLNIMACIKVLLKHLFYILVQVMKIGNSFKSCPLVFMIIYRWNRCKKQSLKHQQMKENYSYFEYLFDSRGRR